MIELMMCVSMVAKSPVTGLYPIIIVAPIQTPQKSERITSLVMRAMEMASKGGARESNEGLSSSVSEEGTSAPQRRIRRIVPVRKSLRDRPFTKRANITGG